MPIPVTDEDDTQTLAKTPSIAQVSNTSSTNFAPPLIQLATIVSPAEQLLTYKDLSIKLQVSESYLRQFAKKLMPFVQLGSRIRFKSSDVDAYIENNRTAPIKKAISK
jgi:excisionase family DNA binding protein